MRKFFTIIFLALVLSTTMGVAAVSAEHIGGDPSEGHPNDGRGVPTIVTSANSFIDLIGVVVDWLFVFLVAVSVIFIVLAGFQFVVGGGEPTSVSQARTKLMWAAVGIVIALLAQGVPTALESIFGTGS
jgi:hypothetical protein